MSIDIIHPKEVGHTIIADEQYLIARLRRVWAIEFLLPGGMRK